MNPKIETETVALNPGTIWTDLRGRAHQIKDAAVRLITEGDRRIIEMLDKKSDRDRAFLAKSLVRLGTVSAADISDSLIDQLLPIDVRRIERAVSRLESRFKDTAPVLAISGASSVSDPIKLYPGVVVNGQHAATAVVRLLTRGDIKAILQEPDENRADAELARSIARLGDVEDPDLISEAVQNLTPVDETRIWNAVSELEKKFLITEESRADKPAGVKYEIRATDVLSQPFELNPGIIVDGQPVTRCAVRLLTRREWSEIDRADSEEREDLTIAWSVARIGSIDDRNAIAECVNAMALPDIKRISKEVAALQDSFPS